MGAKLKFWRRSRVSKQGSRDEAVEILFLAASSLVTAPLSNLTRLYYNGSAAKSHSTSTQYRQLRRLVNRRTSRRTSGEWQDKTIEKKIYKSKNLKLYKET